MFTKHKLSADLAAVMRETLRLAPTAPLRSVTPLESTVLHGEFAVDKDVNIVCGIFMAHRDPKVWGEDADQFRPERMLDGKFEAMPVRPLSHFQCDVRTEIKVAECLATLRLRDAWLYCKSIPVSCDLLTLKCFTGTAVCVARGPDGSHIDSAEV